MERAKALITPRSSSTKSKITNYELLQQIGRGSFGEVYKGFYKKSGDIVAIKMLDLDVNAAEAMSLIEKEI